MTTLSGTMNFQEDRWCRLCLVPCSWRLSKFPAFYCLIEKYVQAFSWQNNDKDDVKREDTDKTRRPDLKWILTGLLNIASEAAQFGPR